MRRHILPPRAPGGCLQSGFQLDLSLADEELVEKQKLRVWSTWQWGVGLLVVVIILVMVMVRFFQGKSVNVPGIPSSGK